MKKLAIMISVIAAAGFWMAFNTQAQEAAPEAQITPPPCPMGFERPANCPMGNLQTTGPNMWGMRGGPGGPMMAPGQGMSQGACPMMAPGQGMAQGACPMMAPGSNFTPGPKNARRGANAMMGGPRQGMSKGPKAPGYKKAQRRGWNTEVAPQGWAPRGPRYGYGNAPACPNMCPNVCPNCGCPMMAPGQGMSQGPQGPAFNRGPRQGRGAGAAQGWAPRGQRYGRGAYGF